LIDLLCKLLATKAIS